MVEWHSAWTHPEATAVRQNIPIKTPYCTCSYTLPWKCRRPTRLVRPTTWKYCDGRAPSAKFGAGSCSRNGGSTKKYASSPTRSRVYALGHAPASVRNADTARTRGSTTWTRTGTTKARNRGYPSTNYDHHRPELGWGTSEVRVSISRFSSFCLVSPWFFPLAWYYLRLNGRFLLIAGNTH